VRGDIIGEVGIAETRTRADQPLTFETVEALFHVRSILRTSLLAVVDHVEADGDLLLYHIGHCRSNTGVKGLLVERPAFLPEAQDLLELA
jgi:hypothetical protein